MTERRSLDGETSTNEKDLAKALTWDDDADKLKFTRDWLNSHLLDDDDEENIAWYNYHHIIISKLNKDGAIKKLDSWEKNNLVETKKLRAGTKK
jgi:hypothetical protein